MDFICQNFTKTNHQKFPHRLFNTLRFLYLKARRAQIETPGKAEFGPFLSIANYRILHNVRNAVRDLVSGIYCNSSFKPHRYANCLSEICKNLIILFTFFHRRGSRLSHQLKAKMSSCVVCPFSEPKALQLAYAGSCRHMQQSLGKACLFIGI